MANENPAAVATQPKVEPTRKEKIENLKRAFDSKGMQELVLSAGKENAASLRASLIELYSADSGLMKCDPFEVIKEAVKAAILRLPIIKSLGFAWIIPYTKKFTTIENGKTIWHEKQVPTFQVGAKGWVQLALRSGGYETINVGTIYEGQLKSYDMLTGKLVLDHTGKVEKAKAIGYFAYVEMLNGFKKSLYSTVDEITAHAKKYSKSYDPSKKTNIWVNEFDAMAEKTILTALLSGFGSLSVEVQAVLASDLKAELNYLSPQEEVNQNANQSSMDFDDAELVSDEPDQSEETEMEEDEPDQLEESQVENIENFENQTVPPAKEKVTVTATQRPKDVAKSAKNTGGSKPPF